MIFIKITDTKSSDSCDPGLSKSSKIGVKFLNKKCVHLFTICSYSHSSLLLYSHYIFTLCIHPAPGGTQPLLGRWPGRRIKLKALKVTNGVQEFVESYHSFKADRWLSHYGLSIYYVSEGNEDLLFSDGFWRVWVGGFKFSLKNVQYFLLWSTLCHKLQGWIFLAGVQYPSA